MVKPAPTQSPTTTSQTPSAPQRDLPQELPQVNSREAPNTPEEEPLDEQQLAFLKWSNACAETQKQITKHKNVLANLLQKEKHQLYLVDRELEEKTALLPRLDAKNEEIASLREQQKQVFLALMQLMTQKLELLHEGKFWQAELPAHAQQRVQQVQELLEASLQSAKPQEDDCGAENAQPHEASCAPTESFEDASDPALCLMGQALVNS